MGDSILTFASLELALLLLLSLPLLAAVASWVIGRFVLRILRAATDAAALNTLAVCSSAPH